MWKPLEVEKCVLPRLLYPEIRFFHGETASPEKLTGIFDLIRNSAFYNLELILGNLVDFKTVALAPKDKHGILNVTSALGHMGSIYKPINILPSLSFLHKLYTSTFFNTGSDIAGHNTQHKEHMSQAIVPATSPNGSTNTNVGTLLQSYIVNDTINIPICKRFNNEALIGLHFAYSDSSKQATLTIYGDRNTGNPGLATILKTIQLQPLNTKSDGNESPKLTAYKIPTYYSVKLPSGYISHIEINPGTTTDFTIYSIFALETSYGTSNDSKNVVVSYRKSGQYELPLNTVYAPEFNSSTPNKACTRVPCKYAMLGACSLAVNKYCIGNTYDIYCQYAEEPVDNYNGVPVCGGSISQLAGWRLDNSLLPKAIKGIDGFTLGQTITYAASTLAENPINYRTIQSCLVLEDKPHILRYHPVSFLDENVINENNNLIVKPLTILDKNRCALYDSYNALNPIRIEMTLRSTSMPHMLLVTGDTVNELSLDSSNPRDVDLRYAIIGNTYGIADTISDYIKISENAHRTIATYAD